MKRRCTSSRSTSTRRSRDSTSTSSAWILAAARARLGDLYLLCIPDIPWEADGVRDQPSARRELHECFAARLAEWNATVVVVGGVGAHRLEHALAAVRGWRAAHAQRVRAAKS